MMREGYRGGEDVQAKIEHELGDCLWSVLVIAHLTGTDLEPAFVKTMEELKERIAEI